VSEPPPRASPALEAALLACFLVHLAAMLSMAALLLPTMPGGSAGSDLERVVALARHPWLFRLGWAPWHAAALIDLLLAIALLRTRWIPRAPAIVTLLLTLAALVPDQGGQILWVTRGVTLARQAIAEGDLTTYLAFERSVFVAVAGWAGLLYTLTALAWTWCFAAAGCFPRPLPALSALTFTLFALVSASPLLPPSLRPPAPLIAVGNAFAFPLLCLWLALVTEHVLRRARPRTPSGVHAPWRHPRTGLLGAALTICAESRFLRALGERLPLLAFRSDIREVVYVNYLLPAEMLEPLVPKGLSLQRLGPRGELALFTFLTYQHGHFGPKILGPLRRLLFSPIQTNWRIHVLDPRTGKQGIHFITNAVSLTLYALGARLMSEGMPMHVLARAELERSPKGHLHVLVDPGEGSGPDAKLELDPAPIPEALPAPFDACFTSYRDFLAYCVPQDRAMDSQPWKGTVSRQEIALGIPLEACEPLAGEVRSRAAEARARGASPLCFRVARVDFCFDLEEHDPLPFA
jgi:hypothetical protein